mmetsp:Transcript_18366/g.29613  ORF Transcript_18366/g.29613 Transcript_18366/m.29613 type:complete len:375 (+) Transcript_18366:1046-2170(+)
MIVTFTGFDHVVSEAPNMNGIAASAAVDMVVAVPCIDQVIAVAAGQDVVADTAIQRVIPGIPLQMVVVETAQDAVIAVTSNDEVIALTAINRVVPVTTKHLVVAAACGQAIVSGTAKQTVVSVSGIDCVIPIATRQDIITSSASDQVVAVPATKNVAIAATVEGVISGTGVHGDRGSIPGPDKEVVVAVTALRDFKPIRLHIEGHALRRSTHVAVFVHFVIFDQNGRIGPTVATHNNVICIKENDIVAFATNDIVCAVIAREIIGRPTPPDKVVPGAARYRNRGNMAGRNKQVVPIVSGRAIKVESGQIHIFGGAARDRCVAQGCARLKLDIVTVICLNATPTETVIGQRDITYTAFDGVSPINGFRVFRNIDN